MLRTKARLEFIMQCIFKNNTIENTPISQESCCLIREKLVYSYTSNLSPLFLRVGMTSAIFNLSGYIQLQFIITGAHLCTESYVQYTLTYIHALHMYVHKYVCKYICKHTSMYIYIHTYIHTYANVCVHT